MGCACINVAMGSYANQIEVPAPEVLRTMRAAAGLSGTICLDRCVAAEVQALWAKGITTTGCCCGHNTAPPFIGVVPADIGRMKAMGYAVAHNPGRPGDEDSFSPQQAMA